MGVDEFLATCFKILLCKQSQLHYFDFIFFLQMNENERTQNY